jgi:hypothetical protein
LRFSVDWRISVAYAAAWMTIALSLVTSTGSCTGTSGVCSASEYTLHSSILIVGDENFTSENGVSGGSGTADDPFIISGWEINASTQAGIQIVGTSKHLTIDQVKIHGNGSQNGVWLQSSFNVSVIGSTIRDCDHGIAAEWSFDVSGFSNLTVADNCCIGSSQYGAFIYMPLLSKGIVVSNNTLVRNGEGGICIEGGGASGVVVSDNFVSGFGTTGIYADESIFARNYVANDASETSPESGLFIACSVEAQILNNTFVCTGGDVGRGGVAVDIISGMGGRSPILLGNRITNWATGISLTDLQDAVVQGNVLTLNYKGLHVFGGETVVVGNVFDQNTIQAEAIPSPFSLLGVAWNGTYPSGGNYWSDHPSLDEMMGPGQDTPGSDGICDDPYFVNETNIDYFPLMAPPDVNMNPVAAFTLAPPSGDVFTTFCLNASCSSDDEDAVEDLEVRWDIDGDGVWDSDWSLTKTMEVVYDIPGTYVVRLEVRDTDGSIDVSEVAVEVVYMIPEFSVMPLVVLAFMVMVAVLSETRRRKRPNE